MSSSKDSNPYLGCIKIVAWSVPGVVNNLPAGWMFCQGQTMQITTYKDLFNLIGTTYGGDGVNNFKLPDLQCYAPLGAGILNTGGSSINLGQTGGSNQNSVSQASMPLHTHATQVTQPNASVLVNSGNASQNSPSIGSSVAAPGITGGRSFQGTLGFNTTAPNTNLANASISLGNVSVQNSETGTASPQPFNTQPPFLGLNFVICVQ